MNLVKKMHRPLSAHTVGHLDDFEERVMFGDLGALLDDIGDDTTISEELLYGVESLKFFRHFYSSKADNLSTDDRTRLAAYDTAWCAELIELAQRERAGRHYRA